MRDLVHWYLWPQTGEEITKDKSKITCHACLENLADISDCNFKDMNGKSIEIQTVPDDETKLRRREN